MWFLEGFLGGGNDGIFCCTACIVWFKRTNKTKAKSWRRIYTAKAICGYGPPSVWTESERRTNEVIDSKYSEANDEGGTAPSDTSVSAGVTAPQVEGGGARHVPAPEPSSEKQPTGAGTQPNLPAVAGTQQPDTQEQSPGATPEAPGATPEAPGATPSAPGETPAEPVDASAAVATVTTGTGGTSAAVATATTRPESNPSPQASAPRYINTKCTWRDTSRTY